MKAWMAWILVASTLAYLPAAEAHQCNGGMNTCGDCVKGEAHNHNDGKGQCSSGPGYYTKNGWGGQEADVPAWGLLGTLAALGGVALLVARRAA